MTTCCEKISIFINIVNNERKSFYLYSTIGIEGIYEVFGIPLTVGDKSFRTENV